MTRRERKGLHQAKMAVKEGRNRTITPGFTPMRPLPPEEMIPMYIARLPKSDGKRDLSPKPSKNDELAYRLGNR